MDENRKQMPELARVPLIRWDQAARWAADDAYEAIAWITTSRKVGPDAFALIVADPAMFREFPRGSTVVVDPEVQPASQACVVAIPDGGEKAVLRTLAPCGPDDYLVAGNPCYADEMLSDRSDIIGVVAQMFMDFNDDGTLTHETGGNRWQQRWPADV